jgi:hypothetical protein
MINDIGIKFEFYSFSEKVWIQGLLDYSAFAEIVLKILLPFSVTSECEVDFKVCFKLKLNTEVGSA